MDPVIAEGLKRKDKAAEASDITRQRNLTALAEGMLERDSLTRDFYNSYDPLTATSRDKAKYDS